MWLCYLDRFLVGLMGGWTQVCHPQQDGLACSQAACWFQEQQVGKPQCARSFHACVMVSFVPLATANYISRPRVMWERPTQGYGHWEAWNIGRPLQGSSTTAGFLSFFTFLAWGVLRCLKSADLYLLVHFCKALKGFFKIMLYSPKETTHQGVLSPYRSLIFLNHLMRFPN